MFEDIVDEEKYASYAKLCNILRNSDKLNFSQSKSSTDNVYFKSQYYFLITSLL